MRCGIPVRDLAYHWFFRVEMKKESRSTLKRSESIVPQQNKEKKRKKRQGAQRDTDRSARQRKGRTVRQKVSEFGALDTHCAHTAVDICGFRVR